MNSHPSAATQVLSIRTEYLTDSFLLSSGLAERLYHDYARDLPIIDYHNHLPPDQVAANHRFGNLTEVWLGGDHYKWRAMRANGVSEAFITGAAAPREKHRKWAETLPYTLRNPLFHWSHLELQRYFGVKELLTGANADRVYDHCSEQLQGPGHDVLGLLSGQRVEVIGTTDDPVDSLEHHQAFARQGHALKMFPSFRPDKGLDLAAEGWNGYIDQLAEASDLPINSFDELLAALENRIDFFHSLGCRISDHGLGQIFDEAFTYGELAAAFTARRGGGAVSSLQARQFQVGLLVELGRMYHARGWTQQFHLGAIRNNNSRIIGAIGADAGCDSIGDYQQAPGLARLLDSLDQTDQLARTILYNLNPAYNEVFATMAGNFNDGSLPGKVQYGAAWWFLDQLDGMEKQMNVLSNVGLLSRFVGMLTDSRSFLSFPRHEYFRRLLCDMFARDMAAGLVPNDEAWVGKIIQDICYNNAKNYFNFPL